MKIVLPFVLDENQRALLMDHGIEVSEKDAVYYRATHSVYHVDSANSNVRVADFPGTAFRLPQTLLLCQEEGV